MAPGRVPQEAIETAQEKLTSFRKRLGKTECKTFEVVNASEESMQSFLLPSKIETQLTSYMEMKTRLPCVVCQGEKGVMYCSITFVSLLSQKQRISQAVKFKSAFYCIIFPNENIFYTTRAVVPTVIGEAIVQLYGGRELKQIPLTGKDFRSLRQLYFNGLNKGLLCRRPVIDDLPLDDNINDDNPADETDDVIEDEDEPWKRKKNSYYRQHFCPESDPTITKFTVSSSSKFNGIRTSRHLNCDLKVTFRTDNLLTFFNYSMDKGVLKYPLNPFLENVVNHGRTSISINSQE